MSVFYDKLVQLCDDIDVSVSVFVERVMQKNKEAAAAWRDGGKLTARSLNKILNFFIVSKEYLTDDKMPVLPGMGASAKRRWLELIKGDARVRKIWTQSSVDGDILSVGVQSKAAGALKSDTAEKTASFWDRLKLACKKEGVTVAKVAADLGIARRTPENWKKRPPSGTTVLALARRLHVTTDSLLSDTGAATANAVGAEKPGGLYAMDIVKEMNKRHNETIQKFVETLGIVQKETTAAIRQAAKAMSESNAEIKSAITGVADQLALFGRPDTKKRIRRGGDPDNT